MTKRKATAKRKIVGQGSSSRPPKRHEAIVEPPPLQIEAPLCHNGFPLNLDDHKNKMESSPIFFVRV